MSLLVLHFLACAQNPYVYFNRIRGFHFCRKRVPMEQKWSTAVCAERVLSSAVLSLVEDYLLDMRFRLWNKQTIFEIIQLNWNFTLSVSLTLNSTLLNSVKKPNLSAPVTPQLNGLLRGISLFLLNMRRPKWGRMATDSTEVFKAVTTSKGFSLSQLVPLRPTSLVQAIWVGQGNNWVEGPRRTILCKGEWKWNWRRCPSRFVDVFPEFKLSVCHGSVP